MLDENNLLFDDKELYDAGDGWEINSEVIDFVEAGYGDVDPPAVELFLTEAVVGEGKLTLDVHLQDCDTEAGTYVDFLNYKQITLEHRAEVNLKVTHECIVAGHFTINLEGQAIQVLVAVTDDSVAKVVAKIRAQSAAFVGWTMLAEVDADDVILRRDVYAPHVSDPTFTDTDATEVLITPSILVAPVQAPCAGKPLVHIPLPSGVARYFKVEVVSASADAAFTAGKISGYLRGKD